jgi:F0F1-type ATP synthase assembly protein I
LHDIDSEKDWALTYITLDQKEYPINNPRLFAMAQDEDQQEEGSFQGVGRWLALSSEMPCMVVIMLYIGQIVGTAWGGQPGGNFGAMIGAILGFIIGTISVYYQVERLEAAEGLTRQRKKYMPSLDEIYAEVDLPPLEGVETLDSDLSLIEDDDD